MASNRVCCRWCRTIYVVPLDAQSLSCPSCCAYAANGRVQKSNAPPKQLSELSHAYGHKRAVLCGITYKGHRNSLRGSVNNVTSMKRLLLQKFRFPLSSILVLTGIVYSLVLSFLSVNKINLLVFCGSKYFLKKLTWHVNSTISLVVWFCWENICGAEEEEDDRRVPTKRNIRRALGWLVEGSRAGDSLVFFYSGHGSQVRDHDGDELDGYDESLLPVDYETKGRILDDELNVIIVRPLPRGATLHAIIDSCFSGTFLDLTNVCRINRS